MSRSSNDSYKQHLFEQVTKKARVLAPQQWITIVELAITEGQNRIIKSEHEIARHTVFPEEAIPIDEAYSLEPLTREKLIDRHQERKAMLTDCVQFLVAAKALLLQIDAERFASLINFSAFSRKS